MPAAKKGFFQYLKDQFDEGVRAGEGTVPESSPVDVDSTEGPSLEEIRLLVDGARGVKAQLKDAQRVLGVLQDIDLETLEQVKDFEALAAAMGGAQYVVRELLKTLDAVQGGVGATDDQTAADDGGNHEAGEEEEEEEEPVARALGEPCTCGALVKTGAQFCGACGKKVSAKPVARFCLKCGAQRPTGSSFCGGCGTPRG